jgi:8-amino-3,8-dideoxy-alpha-D-manno-octulosonate transaminase
LHALQAPARLAVQTLANCPDFRAISLPESDAIMQRAISMQIKLGWTQEQLDQRTQATVKVLKTLI